MIGVLIIIYSFGLMILRKHLKRLYYKGKFRLIYYGGGFFIAAILSGLF